MISDFDPARYPGPRPSGPVLVRDGRLQPLELDGPSERAFRFEDLRWSVAYGSNASPGRLVAKGLDRPGAVLLPARLAGHAPAFEHRRTAYGSVPLTLVPSPGIVHDTWVLGLPAEAIDLLDRTEGRVPGPAPAPAGPESGDGRFAPPGTYRLGRVGDVAVADRFTLPSALAYLPGPSTRVQVVDGGGWRTWPRWDQADAGAHVDAAGPHRSAPDLVDDVDDVDDVLGAWPATPLVDLPLFVYGTLQPGGPAFERIAGLVRVVGTATASGSLHDLGSGWPAAVFRDPSVPVGATAVGEPETDPASPRIRGHLLAPRGPAEAATLFARTDRYEGAPELFLRSSVLVDGPDGPVWAATYAWPGEPAPGTRIPTGKWVVR